MGHTKKYLKQEKSATNQTKLKEKNFFFNISYIQNYPLKILTAIQKIINLNLMFWRYNSELCQKLSNIFQDSH
jgi:hypothetical protein